MRGSVLHHFQRDLAVHEQVRRRRRPSASGSGRFSPLVVASVFVAFFLVPSPCSSVPVLRPGTGANQEATGSYAVLWDEKHGNKTGQKHRGKDPFPPDKPPSCHGCYPPPSRSPPHDVPHPTDKYVPPPSPLPLNPPPQSPTPPVTPPSLPSLPLTPPPPRSPQLVSGDKNNLVWTLGWSFLGIALLLQVALGGFLVYRRRDLQRLGSWME